MIVSASNIEKQFYIQKKNSFLSYFNPTNKHQKVVNALNGVSLSIRKGEKVALIGKNGAGKSTFIKILTGVIRSDNGTVRVFGNDPLVSRQKNNMRIGALFGQRTQLRWDISPYESFLLLKSIYRIESYQFREQYEKLELMLDLSDFVKQPVRTLSLGQKMRAELCATLLHKPELVLLDEPTIGLDIKNKVAILSFLQTYAETEKATILFTSHNYDDIEELCERIVVFDKGTIIYDEKIDELRNQFDCLCDVLITCNNKLIDVTQITTEYQIEIKDFQLKIIDAQKNKVPFIIQNILENNEVLTINVENKKFESLVKLIYQVDGKY